MEVALVTIKNGIQSRKVKTFEKVMAGLVNFGQWLNDVGLKWEIVVDENTKVALEVFVNYDNRMILSCNGTPEVIQQIRVMVGQQSPKMFY